jgi:hypothetical protein
MTKLIVLSLIFSIFITGIALAQERAPEQVMNVAQCAQDIADFKHNGVAGVLYATEVLEQLVRKEMDPKLLNTECRRYVSTHKKTKVSREDQLRALGPLKAQLQPEVYFFLRGAIRPLIACTKTRTRLHRVCRSATGKSWYETGVHTQTRKHKVIYRLGHSEVLSGIIVRGPQDYVSEEDLEYIQSLPEAFVGTALENIENELEAKYLRLKIFMLPKSTRFIEHYFLE